MSAADHQALTPDEFHLLESLLSKVSGQGGQLPWPLFRFINEVTATPNIDLLARDPDKGVLLAWRDDPFGTGWHVPGSVIRHREEIPHRIAACLRDEFGCGAAVDDRPVALIQIFDDRGHSVSLCFTARLHAAPGRRVIRSGEAPAAGDLCWFDRPPAHLYPSHLVYREILGALVENRLGAGIPLFTQHTGAREAGRRSGAGSIASDADLA